MKLTCEELIGLTKEVAIEKIEAAQCKWRYANVDGRAIVGIRNYDPERFNLWVQNDVVVKATLN